MFDCMAIGLAGTLFLDLDYDLKKIDALTLLNNNYFYFHYLLIG